LGNELKADNRANEHVESMRTMVEHSRRTRAGTKAAAYTTQRRKDEQTGQICVGAGDKMP